MQNKENKALELLKKLLELKEHKNKKGKYTFYAVRQPQLWQDVKELISKYQSEQNLITLNSGYLKSLELEAEKVLRQKSIDRSNELFDKPCSEQIYFQVGFQEGYELAILEQSRTN